MSTLNLAVAGYYRASSFSNLSFLPSINFIFHPALVQLCLQRLPGANCALQCHANNAITAKRKELQGSFQHQECVLENSRQAAASGMREEMCLLPS